MLEKYLKKRRFDKTPEPKPGKIKFFKKPIFVVHKHQARNLHYDFRLAINGILKSWAVPKGVPKESGQKVLAIEVEDHPLEYANFEGEIPKGEYGAGFVKIWDKGNFKVLAGSVDKGHLQIEIFGDKLKGEYNLIRFNPKETKLKERKNKNLWLLFKRNNFSINSRQGGFYGFHS